MKEFLELVGKDPELKEKVRELDKNGTMADMIALAAQHGVTLTEADFAKYEGELSEDELSAVADGRDVFDRLEDFFIKLYRPMVDINNGNCARAF